MFESRRDSPEGLVLTWDDLQALTEPTASYVEFSDPDTILQHGLGSELVEVRKEIGKDPHMLAGEIGDVIWYISEIARSREKPLSTILKWSGAIDTYQQFISSLPFFHHRIITSSDEELDIMAEPGNAIAIYGSRVIDSMSPPLDRKSIIWQGIDPEEEPNLDTTIQDLVNCLCIVASNEGISLSVAIQETLHKLEQRPRRPHVIEHGPDKSHRWDLLKWIITTARDNRRA